MTINSDFRDLLRLFDEGGVRYLIVGGYAVMRYTEPRYTKDIDLWVDRSEENALRVMEALRRFGAPLAGITVKDFTDPEVIYQLGIDPNRVDILPGVSGLEFEQAWENRVVVDFGGFEALMVSQDDLIVLKRATDRRQDRIDLKRLQKSKRAGLR
jgi:predicted nucleotidyltransferase